MGYLENMEKAIGEHRNRIIKLEIAACAAQKDAEFALKTAREAWMASKSYNPEKNKAALIVGLMGYVFGLWALWKII